MEQTNSSGEVVLLSSIVSNLGLVLSRTKDALLKDLLGESENYHLELGAITQNGNPKKIDEAKITIEKFIENLFTRLGYDISNFEQSKELYELVQSLIVTTHSVGENVKSIAKKTSLSDWMQAADEAKEMEGENNVWDLTTDNVSVAVSFADNDMTKLFDSIKGVISLIQKFKAFEFGNLKAEYGDFFDYAEETYFTKKFAERLFDHIIVVILQNAKEVFADDINLIIEKCGEKVNDTVKELYAELQVIQKKIDNIKANVEQRINETLQELEIKHKLIKTKLEKELSKLFGEFNTIGDGLQKAYAIIDFLQLTTKDTIEIAKYIPANAGNVDFNKYFDSADLRPIEINTIHWKRLEELFSNPMDYLSDKYPINNYADAEELMAKIITVAQAFSLNVPDFSSMKQLLMELLIRITEKIKAEGKLWKSEVVEMFNKCKDFIVDLLKILENIAIEIRDEFTKGFKQVSSNSNSIFSKLEGNFTDIRKTLAANYGEIKDNLPINTVENIIKNISLPSLPEVRFVTINSGIDVRKILNSSFLKIISEKAAKYDLFEQVKYADWQTMMNAASANSIVSKYKSVLGTVETDLIRIFNETYWNEQFKKVYEALKTEFDSQTKDIPTNKEELVNMATKWISGDGKNPFSGFDFYAYFAIVSNRIKTLLPTPDDYYKELKKATFESLNELKSSIAPLKSNVEKIGEAEFKKKLYAFVNDVFADCWKNLKNELIKPLIYPFLQMVEYEVKQWANKLLADIIDAVESKLNSLQIDVEKYNVDAFKDNFSSIKNLLELYKNTASDGGLNSWRDGLNFALELYKVIPKEIKLHMSELANFNLPTISSSIQLPEYKLDVKNKFIAVTLYQYPDHNNNGSSGYQADGAVIGGSFSFKLVAFVGERAEGKKNDKKAGIYLLPIVNSEFDSGFNLGGKHVLELVVKAALNGVDNKESSNDIKKKLQDGALGFFFSKSDFVFLNDNDDFSTSLDLILKRGNYKGKTFEKADKISLLESEYLDITLDDYPQTLHVGYEEYKDKTDKTKHGFNFEYIAAIENAAFTLKIRETNDFFNTVLKDDIKFNVDKLAVSYSWAKGFTVDGKTSLQLNYDFEKTIGNVKFKNVGLELSSGNFHNLLTSVTTSFSVDFKGIAFALPDIGLGVDFNYMMPNGGLGDFDFSGQLVFPSGIGISIDVPGVKGTGIIKYDKTKQEFLGALELIIVEKIGINAMVLFNMKMPDGSKGFSFMGLLSVSFNPGIQLGMGFSLTAVGGAFGLNRSLDTEKIQTAVRDGTLGSYMFVENIADKMETVLANISSFYPVTKEQYFFGFLAEIAYAELLKLKAGLFIQAPNPVSIVIIGAVSLNVSDSVEKLISINAYFAGGIDFSKGLWFDASLVDSQIVGIQFYGDVAFRVYWAGNTKGFLLSAGGFHPQFTPDAGFNVGVMKRLGMKLSWDIITISLENYFAVTSNSVQFGADFQLKIGWKKFGLFGYMGFDVLFMFNPFKFVFDVRAGVAVKLGRVKLFSINLSLQLSGPARWNAKGKASFWFLFIKIGVNFNVSWGKSQKTTDKQLLDLYPLFATNFHDKNNWSLISSDIADNLVTLADLNREMLIMQPSDTLSFAQDALPLEQQIDCYGQANPGDIRKIELKEINIGGIKLNSKEYEMTSSSFAPSLIRNLTDNEKLVEPSYTDMRSGFQLKVGENLQKSKTVVDKTLEYNYENEIDMKQFFKVSSTEREFRTRQKELKKVMVSDETEDKQSAPFYKRFATKAIGLNQMNTKLLNQSNLRRSPTGFKRYVSSMQQNVSEDLHACFDILKR